MRLRKLLQTAVLLTICNIQIALSQNIGINTDGSAGQTLLHTKNTNAAADNILRIENTISGKTTGINIFNSTYTGTPSWLFYNPASTTDLRLQYNAGTDAVTFLSTGNVGIGTIVPGAKLDIRSSGESVYWGANALTYPTTPTAGQGNLVGKSSTSDYRIALQDGNNRVNHYWNAYYDATALSYKNITANEPSVRLRMGISGAAEGFIDLFSAPSYVAAGSNLTWTNTAYFSNVSAWISPRGISSDFYIPATTGYVGIGTISPLSLLHIYKGTSGNTMTSTYSQLDIENNADAGIMISNPDANVGRILFGTPSRQYGALIRWDYTNNNFDFSTDKAGGYLRFLTDNFTERMRITSTGALSFSGVANYGTPGQVLTSNGNATPSWQAASGAGTNWLLLGNGSTVDGTNFIGTTDNIPFNIRVNNIGSGRITSGGSTFLGYQAGVAYTGTSNTNTGIGYQALMGNLNTVGGTMNTALGYQALLHNDDGSEVCAGPGSSYSNTAIGYTAMKENVCGIWNTALGAGALEKGTDIYQNTAIGHTALNNNRGNGNTAVGFTSQEQNTTGQNNTSLGATALYNGTTGSNNIAIGVSALNNGTYTGTQNLAIGGNSLSGTTTGSNNVAIGPVYFDGFSSYYGVGRTNTTGSNNVLIGYRSDFGSGNLSNATAIGSYAYVTASNSLILGSINGVNSATASTNVGIGTTAPGQKLVVAGGNISHTAYNAGTNYFIQQTLGNVSAYIWPSYSYAGTAGAGGGGWNDGTVWSANWQGITGNTDNFDVSNPALKTTAIKQCRGYIEFYTENTGSNTVPIVRMSVVPSGYVGIGTSAPGAFLNVVNSGVNNTVIGQFDFTGGNVGGTTEPCALVRVTTNSGFRPLLSLKPNAGTGVLVDAAGNVGIGTTAPSYKLEVCGSIGTTSASVTTGISCSSDIRLKKDITPIPNALSSIISLRGVNYFWRTKDFPNKGFSDTKQIGFVAQEIEKVYPELVTTQPDGYKAVDYSRLTPVLVEAIKEQQKMIEELKSENEKLKADSDARFTKLEAEMKILMQPTKEEAKK